MMFPTSITKEEVMQRPLESYSGKVEIVSTEETIVQALEEVSKSSVVGFDTEARPTFKKGQIRKISLIQIATNGRVYLLRIKKTGLIEPIVDFLNDKKIVKVGIGLEDDILLLNKLKPFRPGGFLDLNKEVAELGAESIGARNLAAMILNIRISKSSQTSNWEVESLTQKQIRYAATDAWICLEMYKKLQFWGYLT